MDKVFGYIKSLLGVFGSGVDAAVPVAVGDRTVGAVLIGLAAKVAPSLLPLVPEPYHAAIVGLLPIVSQLVTVLASAFAVAHVVRAEK